MGIPKGFKGEIHAYYNTEFDYISFMAAGSLDGNKNFIYLGKVADVDVTFADHTAAIVDAFDKQIEAVRAEMLQRIEILKGKRAEFLALEVQP